MPNTYTAIGLRSLMLSGLVALAAGCADTAKFLRSEPMTHYPLEPQIATAPDLANYLRLHCIVQAEWSSYQEKSGQGGSECLYVSAEVNPLAAQEPSLEVRKQIIATLVYYSDLNCSNFLHRAFANRAALDVTKTFLQDITTGASAVTAFSTPAASAVLSGANLIIGKGVADFDATYYLDKTFQAMQDAIASERSRRLALILAQRGDGKYLWPDILSLLRSYDDACSIRDGLDQLTALAQQTKDTNEEKKNNVQADPTMRTFKAQKFGKQSPSP